MADDETGSVEYSPEDLEYFATQLRKSGKFHVTSTPNIVRLPRTTYSATPTPTREFHKPPADRKDPETPSFFPPTVAHTFPDINPPQPVNRSFVPPHMNYIHPRIPDLPSFSGDGKLNTSMFEIWRYDVNCLLDEGIYPPHIVREAIRKSLKGSARGVLLHLGEHASVSEIISELEGIYGNVQSGERLKEQFYSEKQKADESVGDYSLRLERLLSRVPGHLDRTAKNDMLRNRLWSGLRNIELKNASRYLFEKNLNYNTLRKELRAVEEDLRLDKAATPDQPPPNKPDIAPPSKTDIKPPPSVDENLTIKSSDTVGAKQFATSVESRLLKELTTLSRQMERMESRMAGLEKEVKDLRKDRSDHPDRDSKSKPDTFKTSEKPLNSNRPPSQGR